MSPEDIRHYISLVVALVVGVLVVHTYWPRR